MILSREVLQNRNKYGYYLSEATRVNEFEYGKFNHINAPVGSGKTTYVAGKLLEDLESKYGKRDGLTVMLAPYNMLEDQVEQEGLFDKATDNHVLAMKGFVFCEGLTTEDIENLKGSQIVMTPHRFFRLMKYDNVAQHIDTLIIDESDHTFCRLPQWEEMSNKGTGREDDIFKNAAATIKSLLRDIMVVSISATGKSGLQNIFNGYYNDIVFKEKLRRYIPKSVEDYSNLKLAYDSAKEYGSKVAIYIQSITSMKQYREYFESLGLTVDMIVSDYATEKYDMSDKEKQIKRDLASAKGTSENIGDILLFNAAMERGVSINDKNFHSVIVHSSNEDTQTQVVGRFRFNGMRIWKLANEENRVRLDRISVVVDRETGLVTDNIVIPSEYLDTPLTSTMRNEMIKDIGYNRSWRALKKIIVDDYDIRNHTKTIKGKRTRVETITKK